MAQIPVLCLLVATPVLDPLPKRLGSPVDLLQLLLDLPRASLNGIED
jgi:hypothetical protein